METVSGWNVLAKRSETERKSLELKPDWTAIDLDLSNGKLISYLWIYSHIHIPIYIYTHKYVGVCLCVCISVTWVFGIIHNKAGDSFTYYPLLTIVSVTSQRGVIIINLSGLSNPRVSFRDHLKVSRGQYSKMLDFQFQLSDERQHLDRSPWISI